MGDFVYDETTGKSYYKVRFTGPLKAGSTTTIRRTTNLFCSFSYSSSIMSEVVIEYADGTRETIKNENFKFYYDLSVPK